MGRLGVSKRDLFSDYYPEEVALLLRLAAEELGQGVGMGEPEEVEGEAFFGGAF